MGPAHRSRFRSRAAVIVTLAALPILWTPNVVVARMVVGGFRVAIPGALLFAADGWIATGYVFVWQIALTRCRATRPRGSPGLAQTLAPLAGNRGFESTSLQRRVCKPETAPPRVRIRFSPSSEPSANQVFYQSVAQLPCADAPPSGTARREYV